MNALPHESVLVRRALDLLAAGPVDAGTLVAHACELPRLPAPVAQHLAVTLFAARSELARTDDGRWCARPPMALSPAPPRAPPPPPPLLALPYAVVDVETTGGRPLAGDRVTEIAAVVVQNGAVVEVFETLLNPQRPIPPMITALTNISWQMVERAPVFGDVAPRLTELLRGRVFVAHNAAFDWSFVSAEFRRASATAPQERRLCTVRLARRLLPQLARRSLGDLARYFGIANHARHRAAGDAVATATVLLRLLQVAADAGCVAWPDLDALLQRGARRPRRRPPSRLGPTDGAADA